MDSDGGKAEVVQDPTALLIWDEQTRRFTFSFFESDAKDEKEETNRVEAVKPVKIAWQGDPGFQDSSSEEEDVTEEGDDKKHSPEVSLPEKETTRFFFFKNDDRLHGSDFSGKEWEVILAGTLGKSEQTT